MQHVPVRCQSHKRGGAQLGSLLLYGSCLPSLCGHVFQLKPRNESDNPHAVALQAKSGEFNWIYIRVRVEISHVQLGSNLLDCKEGDYSARARHTEFQATHATIARCAGAHGQDDSPSSWYGF